MRRGYYLLGLLALFGAVFASAAWLGVNSGGLQSGYDEVICDSNGVDVKYQNTDSDARYDQATVYGVDCSGTLDVTVDVQDSSHATLAYGTVSSSGPTIVVPFSNELTPSEIGTAHHVHVTIVSTAP